MNAFNIVRSLMNVENIVNAVRLFNVMNIVMNVEMNDAINVMA
jgi:hypothetical protein